ncbi:hypothetical protein [Bremerella alba]|uniref:Uncharacterized protein n=1 Tax=Bremerella alba TaxID=980252 RepID=A0A7V9A5G5_9BACT|nr:hypothetical protein [Bremerella alba]MBA2113330.1 hypothetical protein [Bremerella alba]
MSKSSNHKTHVWIAGVSAAIVVVMAAILFGQVRLVALQNHTLMIDNQKLEIRLDLLKTTLDNQGQQVVAKLDAGWSLTTSRVSPLNIHEDVKGPIIGALLRQLKDDRPFVKLQALQGLMLIHPENHSREIFAPLVVPAVIPALRDPRLKMHAAAVLQPFRSNAKAAAPVVLETADERNWASLSPTIGSARGMDPACDVVPLLTRHILANVDPWKTTLTRLQQVFTPAEVRQSYQNAQKQASDPQLRGLYEGILRYLGDQPPGGVLQSPRDVEEYVRQGES